MKTHTLSPVDALFVQMESGENMMHVAGLNIYKMPAGKNKASLREFVEQLWSYEEVYPPFNYRLENPDNLQALKHRWVEDDNVDLNYHIRRSALPAPGDERELGILVSRLHSNPMDFHRPLWEFHLIEGLKGNRFAVYFKIHHGLIDGISGMKMMARSLSESPDELDKTPLFAVPPRAREPKEKSHLNLPSLLNDAVRSAREQASTARDIGKSMQMLAKSAIGKENITLPFEAPHSALNGRITRSRRFATQQFKLSKLKALSKKADCSLNELVLAICATVLRRFLLEMDALPDKPLVAAIPVSLRAEGDQGGGNQVAMILASLATDIADPAERFQTVVASAQSARVHLQGMSSPAIMAHGTMLMGPFAVQSLTGRLGKARPNFNVVISNVPGPKNTLYFQGAELLASYPVSIPMHGMALNITLQSYADTLNFGFVGCSKTLPHLQHMALYAADAVAEIAQQLR